MVPTIYYQNQTRGKRSDNMDIKKKKKKKKKRYPQVNKLTKTLVW